MRRPVMTMAGQNINNNTRTEAEKTLLDVPIGRKRGGGIGKGDRTDNKLLIAT
jgi:hypothetical protein